jgi:uncharacterized Fe-S cluster protein YjdI
MQEYKNDKLVVRYDPAICIHAGECVHGLPSVFNLSKKPWIDVNGAWRFYRSGSWRCGTCATGSETRG